MQIQLSSKGCFTKAIYIPVWCHQYNFGIVEPCPCEVGTLREDLVFLRNIAYGKCQPATVREKSPKICISEALVLLKLFSNGIFFSWGLCLIFFRSFFMRLLFSHRSLNRKSTAVSSSLLCISHPLSSIFLRNAFPS